jgi:hypothetical protein
MCYIFHVDNIKETQLNGHFVIQMISTPQSILKNTFYVSWSNIVCKQTRNISSSQKLLYYVFNYLKYLLFFYTFNLGHLYTGTADGKILHIELSTGNIETLVTLGTPPCGKTSHYVLDRLLSLMEEILQSKV